MEGQSIKGKVSIQGPTLAWGTGEGVTKVDKHL